MEAHRKNPVCANCHKLFDPIGLAMENFDAVGRLRERDGGSLGVPIDASGELVDGTKVDGVVSLRRALLQPELFVGTVVEKLMTYGLGRGLTADDMPAVRAIIRDAAGRDYRLSAVVLGIVKSTPFTMRIKAIPEANPALPWPRRDEDPGVISEHGWKSPRGPARMLGSATRTNGARQAQ